MRRLNGRFLSREFSPAESFHSRTFITCRHSEGSASQAIPVQGAAMHEDRLQIFNTSTKVVNKERIHQSANTSCLMANWKIAKDFLDENFRQVSTNKRDGLVSPNIARPRDI